MKSLSRKWTRAARAANRGVTLIEILIVLAIVGLLATGVGLVIIPKYAEAQKKTAKLDAIEIHRIADQYRAEHTGEQCPTVELLREKKQISVTSKITDPWETPYKIFCGDEDISVLSFGPDKKENTADDIRVPENAAKPQ